MATSFLWPLPRMEKAPINRRARSQPHLSATRFDANSLLKSSYRQVHSVVSSYRLVFLDSA